MSRNYKVNVTLFIVLRVSSVVNGESIGTVSIEVSGMVSIVVNGAVSIVVNGAGLANANSEYSKMMS